VILEVVPSLVVPATIASHVAIGVTSAFNELLLRERGQRVAGNLVSTFEATSGRERPAGTASTLILNRGDSTVVNPVDTVSGSGSANLNVHGFMAGHVLEAKKTLTLFSGPVGKFVVTSDVSRVTSIVGNNEVFGFLPDVHAHVELFNGTVGFAVFSNKLHEFEVGVIVESVGGDSSSKSGESEFH
jgi:hypothetical protein